MGHVGVGLPKGSVADILLSYYYLVISRATEKSEETTSEPPQIKESTGDSDEQSDYEQSHQPHVPEGAILRRGLVSDIGHIPEIILPSLLVVKIAYGLLRFGR